jgi:hypothetical protein
VCACVWCARVVRLRTRARLVCVVCARAIACVRVWCVVCVCARVCVRARGCVWVCARACVHVPMLVHICAVTLIYGCGSVCPIFQTSVSQFVSGVCSGQLTGDTVPYLPNTSKPQRCLQKGKAELYINRMSMTIIGTVGRGRTQTRVSNRARYTLGTVIFSMLYLYQTNCEYTSNVS